MTPDPGLDSTSTPSSPPTVPPTVATLRSPEDVLALVPVLLGFEPAESLVMLTFGADPPFHARADLPRDPGDLSELVESLVAPARRHGVCGVLLVAYSGTGSVAERALAAVARAMGRAGIEVLGGLRTDGRRWHPVPAGPGTQAAGVPYDVSGHPFAAQAVYDGRVVLGSRDAVAATVRPDPRRVAPVVAALAGLAAEPAPVLEEGSWVRALVERHTREGTCASDAEVARLLRGVLDVRVRDAAWSALRRPVAAAHVVFWSDVVRRTPDPLVPGPAALLAFAAWQAGHGALAWCAVDRCQEVDETYSLAGVVARILEDAVPPTAWEGPVDWTADSSMRPPGAG